MTRLLRATWVIARRDYIATVWSRTFLFFLIFPLVVPAISIGMGSLAARDGGDEAAPPTAIVRVLFDRPGYAALLDARERLATRLGRDALPQFAREAPAGAPLLFGSLEHPHLAASDRRMRQLAGEVGLVIDAARSRAALGPRSPAPAQLVLLPHAVAKPAGPARIAIGRGGQLILFFLNMMLAGMMISNLVEEKSNKVIELLLAAVPVDAIFAGKLIGMLGVSLTGIALWGSAAVAAAAMLLPAGALPPPAVGWPAFVLLGFLYYVMAFSLLGGLYLGLGAQAASVREVQTISLPLSLGQLVVFGLASAGVAHPGGPLALVAAILPWSSPYALIARAAVDPRGWPHLLGLAWQMLAVALTIRVGAGLFRRNILKSGSVRRGGWRRATFTRARP